MTTLVLAAVAHATGSHQHSDMRIDPATEEHLPCRTQRAVPLAR